jgi:molybdopterin-binding protein
VNDVLLACGCHRIRSCIAHSGRDRLDFHDHIAAIGVCVVHYPAGKAPSHSRRGTEMLSARNQLPATVTSVKLGNVMAEVVMSVGEFELVAAITRGSAEQLGLKAGDSVRAVIKATEVLIDKS